MVEVVKEVLSFGRWISKYAVRCKVTKDGREWIELYGIVWSMKPIEEVWDDLKKTAEEIEQKFNVKCLVAITPSGHVPTVFLALENIDKHSQILKTVFTPNKIAG